MIRFDPERERTGKTYKPPLTPQTISGDSPVDSGKTENPKKEKGHVAESRMAFLSLQTDNKKP